MRNTETHVASGFGADRGERPLAVDAKIARRPFGPGSGVEGADWISVEEISLAREAPDQRSPFDQGVVWHAYRRVLCNRRDLIRGGDWLWVSVSAHGRNGSYPVMSHFDCATAALISWL